MTYLPQGCSHFRVIAHTRRNPISCSSYIIMLTVFYWDMGSWRILVTVSANKMWWSMAAWPLRLGHSRQYGTFFSKFISIHTLEILNQCVRSVTSLKPPCWKPMWRDHMDTERDALEVPAVPTQLSTLPMSTIRHNHEEGFEQPSSHWAGQKHSIPTEPCPNCRLGNFICESEYCLKPLHFRWFVKKH